MKGSLLAQLIARRLTTVRECASYELNSWMQLVLDNVGVKRPLDVEEQFHHWAVESLAVERRQHLAVGAVRIAKLSG
eukprot:CAMPEP_0171139218 /NCGR_PEP_ID=MMETSP0766_2-20121228/136482_1 /TAXON_ID=439317 /ORGANISM="Gambierdiscus australes, Strain CAWD 149" /LENGTH=76 /DNA_ID=CAMNT_0011602867 /DNA_START=66 /DNA_END=294 /DNA_ORIENTATION=-